MGYLIGGGSCSVGEFEMDAKNKRIALAAAVALGIAMIGGGLYEFYDSKIALLIAIPFGIFFKWWYWSEVKRGLFRKPKP